MMKRITEQEHLGAGNRPDRAARLTQDTNEPERCRLTDELMKDVLTDVRALETLTGAVPVSESQVATLLPGRPPDVVEAVTCIALVCGVVVMDGSPAFELPELREALDALPDTGDRANFESVLRRLVPSEIDDENVRLVFEFARGVRHGVAPTEPYVEVVCDVCSFSLCRHQVKAALPRESFKCQICGGERLCLMVAAHDDVFDEADAAMFGVLRLTRLQRYLGGAAHADESRGTSECG